MLPGMPAKRSFKERIQPSITIVGAGNLAWALGTSLRAAGYTVDQIVSRGNAASVRRARMLATTLDTQAVRIDDAQIHDVQINAKVVWFCVPDGVIAEAAEKLKASSDWAGKVALHSSGALTSDELNILRQNGAAVASVHPMMTFVQGSQPPLREVPFAIEGDAKAVRAARKIVKRLGGKAYSIRREQKAAYHAWATFASPLLTALLATAERVAAGAGVKAKGARRRVLPMLKQTLVNYETLGAAGGFSGPIVRGDIETVKRHLEVLGGTPAAREVYQSLARAATEYLPGKNKAELKKVLESSRGLGSKNSLRRSSKVRSRSQR
jgi:predicted short-subunit dehydrogenase-like oxidoreductase (DUF2520 family)